MAELIDMGDLGEIQVITKSKTVDPSVSAARQDQLAFQPTTSGLSLRTLI